MRILLDECVPRPLMHELAGHDVRTVQDMGWSGKKNGELLQLMMPQGFDAFVTCDQNMQYQQQQSTLTVAVIVMIAGSNRLVDLLPLVPSVLAALTGAKSGEVIEVRN